MNVEKTVASLRRNRFAVSVFPDRASAARYLDRQIDHTTVGIGGSVTIDQMDLFPLLARHNQVFWHHRPAAGRTQEETLHDAAEADVYLTSVNALSETGELVNIDGRGNRVASTLYGHRKVYFIAGTNKIAPDLTQAIERARNVASPRNAARLACKTPCAVKGDKCHDCNSPERICNAMVIHFRRMLGDCEMEVILIEETLGY